MARKRRTPFRHKRPPGCVSPDEAAAFLGISEESVKNQIQTGKLTAIRNDDGRWWIKAAGLRNESPEGTPRRRRKSKRGGSTGRQQVPRNFSFNLDAAEEFGFSIEKAIPLENDSQLSTPPRIKAASTERSPVMPEDDEIEVSPEVYERVRKVAKRLGITPDEFANAAVRVALEGMETDPDYMESEDFAEKAIAEIRRLQRKRKRK